MVLADEHGATRGREPGGNRTWCRSLSVAALFVGDHPQPEGRETTATVHVLAPSLRFSGDHL
jgi:hypothetical protein